ncbi:MAG: AEC family transporter [Thiotrichaceae bacterium]|nr:AEC family transporter [Thiotrichaceae bacterium]
MYNIYSTLTPIFLIIILGYSLKNYCFSDNNFWKALENITYFVLLPILMVDGLVKTPLENFQVSSLAMATLGGVFIISLLLVALKPLLKTVSGAEFSSIFQGSIRFNSYICMAVAHALNPKNGVALAALIMAVIIPIVNVISVIVLEHYAAHTPTRWQNIVKALLKNPLVISCALGFALSKAHVSFPVEIHETFKILGGAALPLGLLAMGAGLQLSTVRNTAGSLLLTSFLKLGLMPILTWVICRYLGVSPEMQQVVILYSALPTASTSYILARQMGGDYVLMANIITLETIICAFTLPWVLINLT